MRVCVEYLFTPSSYPFLESKLVSCKFYKICLEIVLLHLVGSNCDRMPEVLYMTFIHGTQMKCLHAADVSSSFRQLFQFFSSVTADTEGLLRGPLERLRF
jgi:hypothetical protein